MSMSNFDELKNEIERILPNSPIENDLAHAKCVLKWVLKLRPDADEDLQIAALSHDIDRAVTGITEKDNKDHSKYAEFKKEHSMRSAGIIEEMMKRYGYDTPIIDKVRHLVENHEFGGDEDTSILTDADSIAYFELNIPIYIKRNGIDKTKKKIRFMYDRLSENAKSIVRSIDFEDEIRDLVKETLG
jgi:hypothetical protein